MTNYVTLLNGTAEDVVEELNGDVDHFGLSMALMNAMTRIKHLEKAVQELRDAAEAKKAGEPK